MASRRHTAQGRCIPSPGLTERFSVAGRLQRRQALRLTLDIVPRRRDVSHTHTAFNCLLCCCLLRAFLLVLLIHCILPASFCTLEYATQNLQTQSNAVLHCHHTAKQTSMRLPRNSTDIIHLPFSFFPFMRSLSTLRITNLEMAGEATCVSLQPGVSSSDRGPAIC